MSNSAIVRLHANVTVNSNDWDKFLQMVAAVKIIVQAEGQENTLTHQTYHQSGSFNCLIIEAYKDEPAFLQHLENIKPLSQKYQVDWMVNSIELSGPYSEATVNALRAGINAKEFTFFDTPVS